MLYTDVALEIDLLIDLLLMFFPLLNMWSLIPFFYIKENCPAAVIPLPGNTLFSSLSIIEEGFVSKGVHLNMEDW